MRVFPWKGCVLLLLLTSFVQAQSPPLTFEQVTELALREHPIERAQRASVRATEALILQAGVKPTLQLQTQTDGFERMSQLGLSVSQRLELGGKKNARVKAAVAEHAENELRAEIRMALFRYELREGFYQLLLAQKAEELALQSLAITERHLEIARTRFEAGDLSGAELATLQVERDRRLAQVELAKGSIAKARAELGRFVQNSDLEGGVEGRLGSVSVLPPMEKLESEGPEGPLALRLARAGLESKEAQVFLERSLGVSDITLQAGAFVQRTVFPGSSYVPSGVIGGLDDTGPLFQFQLQIPIPINDDNSGSIAAALARREQAEAELDALELEVAANLEGLYYTLEGQREARLLLEEQAEPAALKSLQYKLGFRSQLDLLLAKQTYLETRTAILQAGFDEALTAAQLERVLGRSLEDLKENSQ